MCKFCECESELESVAKEWLLDDSFKNVNGIILPGLCIIPKEKEMVFNIHDMNYEEIYIKSISIKYCPMCGREL